MTAPVLLSTNHQSTFENVYGVLVDAFVEPRRCAAVLNVEHLYACVCVCVCACMCVCVRARTYIHEYACIRHEYLFGSVALSANAAGERHPDINAVLLRRLPEILQSKCPNDRAICYK